MPQWQAARNYDRGITHSARDHTNEECIIYTCVARCKLYIYTRVARRKLYIYTRVASCKLYIYTGVARCMLYIYTRVARCKWKGYSIITSPVAGWPPLSPTGEVGVSLFA